jgi:cytochrome c peroxidase
MPERDWRMRLGVATSALALALLVSPVSSLVSHAAWRPRLPLGLDLYMPVPEDNPLTSEKVELGRQLFSDPILSRDKSLACAGCHDPERGFTDGRAVSVGVFGRVGTRSVPTLVNRAYGSSFFWDGRMSSLEEQVLQPIQDPREMDMTLKDVVEELRRDRKYSEQFQAVFGRIPTHVDLAKALASYARTILSGNAPIDRYRNGKREASASFTAREIARPAISARPSPTSASITPASPGEMANCSIQGDLK